MTSSHLHVLAVLGLTVCGAPRTQAQVLLRDDQRAISEPILSVDAQGVTVGDDAATATEVAWDRILRVEGDWADRCRPYGANAELLWRLRIRTERGDWQSAAPLVADLSGELSQQAGPSSRLVAECDLRCRLADNAQTLAVWPYLELLQAREDNERRTLGGTLSLPDLIPSDSVLCPLLPPMWAQGPALQALATSREWERWSSDRVSERMAALALLYHIAACADAGVESGIEPPPTPPNLQIGDAELLLIQDIVLARGPDAGVRVAARQRLSERLKTDPRPPDWQEAWIRAGLGRSLIKETSRTERQRGVIQLLHIPASLGSVQPYLAGLALAEGAAVMESLGDEKSAAAMRNDLLIRFPWHAAARGAASRQTSAQPAETVESEAGNAEAH